MRRELVTSIDQSDLREEKSGNHATLIGYSYLYKLRDVFVYMREDEFTHTTQFRQHFFTPTLISIITKVLFNASIVLWRLIT